jgi:hypothetical protein
VNGKQDNDNSRFVNNSKDLLYKILFLLYGRVLKDAWGKTGCKNSLDLRGFGGL